MKGGPATIAFGRTTKNPLDSIKVGQCAFHIFEFSLPPKQWEQDLPHHMWQQVPPGLERQFGVSTSTPANHKGCNVATWQT
eukprot:3903589-Amphidinium_carterae.1